MKEPTSQDLMAAIIDLRDSMHYGFKGFENRFDGVDARLDCVEARLTSVEGEMRGLGVRMTSVEGEMRGLGMRMISVEGEVRGVRDWTASSDQHFEALERRLTP